MSHGLLTEPEGSPTVYSLSYREDKHGADKRTWEKKDTIPGFPQPCLQKTALPDRISQTGVLALGVRKMGRVIFPDAHH